MTSKNLFFKLMKEDMKRRLWVIALLALALTFALPIGVALITGQDMSWYDDTAYMQMVRKAEMVADYLSPENGFMIFIISVSAILSAFSGFSYLNSRKKVDFYHSIPVKRSTMFAVYYLDGILIVGVIYLLSLALALGVATVNKAMMPMVMYAAWTGFWVHMVGFLIVYATVTAAVLLTGNIVIGFLGSVVFFLYGPALSLLVRGFFETCFRTYGYFGEYGSTVWFEGIFGNLSPFSAYTKMINAVSYQMTPKDVTGTVLQLAGTLAAVAVLTAINFVLYRIRPSESTGKAMAFRKSQTLIKVLLVIPMALTGGICFWAIQDSFGWAVFGLLFTCVVVHSIMEIIYHFDFRKLFAHLPHLAICLAASMLILCGFHFDLFGYDRFLPKEESLDSVAVKIDELDNWVTYGHVEKWDDMEDGYSWSYDSRVFYIFENMHVKDTGDVLAIAEAGIRRNNRIRAGEIEEWSGEEDESLFSNIHVLYRLKSGRKVARSYYLPLSSDREHVERLYLSQEFKKGMYPLMGEETAPFVCVNYQEQDQITPLEAGSKYGKDEELRELLNTYREEFFALSVETRTKESPVGMVQFMDEDMDAAISWMKEEKDYDRYDLEQRCYYPVYPSFTRTIALLNRLGVRPGQVVTADKVEAIDIVDNCPVYREGQRGEDWEYKEYADQEVYREPVEYRFTDPEQIKAIMPCLIPEDYVNLNPFNQTDDYSSVTVSTGTGVHREEYHYRIDVDRMPEFLKQLMNFQSTRRDRKSVW